MRPFLITLSVLGSFAFVMQNLCTQPPVALVPIPATYSTIPVPFPIPTPIPTSEPKPISIAVEPKIPETIDWVAERDWRKEHAKRPDSLVWVHFTLEKNCRNCDIVNRDVIADAQIIEASKAFVCVKLVGPSNRISAWRVTAFPTDIFLDRDHTVLKMKGVRNVPTPHMPEAMGKLFLAARKAASQRRKENEATQNLSRSPSRESDDRSWTYQVQSGNRRRIRTSRPWRIFER